MSLKSISCACRLRPLVLNVIFELLTAFVGPVHVAHRDRPDAAGDPADDRVFGVEPVGEEERQVRGELVDVHASAAVVFHVGEAVGERQWRVG